MKNRETIEFLGLWESLHNQDFKPLEFEGFRGEAGLHAFTMLPPELTQDQIFFKYANEADMLNVVLFGMTAKQWRDANSGKKGNIRDDANLNQLLVLANMESYNAILIGQGKTMSERIVLLRELAVKQMETLSMVSLDGIKQLPGGDSD